MTSASSETMQLQIVADYAAMSQAAADLVADLTTREPQATLAVPTGSTPVGMYQALAAKVRQGTLNLSRARVFCLDEYQGVGPEDPAGLTAWLAANFFGPAGVPMSQVQTVPSTEADHVSAAARYEESIRRAGGLRLAVLGLGGNGHIAFNEPGSTGESRTRVLNLTPESIAQARSAFAGRPTPTQAMTVGVATLLEADRIVLIVSGAGKADMLQRALRGAQTAQVPASFLQRAGRRLTVIADRAAAAKL